MKNDIKSYVKNNASQPQNAPIDENDPAFTQKVENIVNEYSGKSQNELMDELMRRKASGEINSGALGDIAVRLSPMLNSEQQSRLNEILGRLM